MNNEELSFIGDRIKIKKEQLSREKIEIPEEKELITEAIEERMEESLRDLPPEMDFLEPEKEKKAPFPADLYAEDEIPKNEVIEEANIKLSELIAIAFEENIPRAVKIALKTGNAFLIDKLRDSLADKYYEELKEKNLI